METASERNKARATRLAAARAAREKKAIQEQMHATLGDALTAALMRYLAGKPEGEVTPVERAIALVGYSDELKRLIVRCIEANPAMEESFLLIAELAFRDGEDAVKEDWLSYEPI
jgi:hypothetical protein